MNKKEEKLVETGYRLVDVCITPEQAKEVVRRYRASGNYAQSVPTSYLWTTRYSIYSKRHQ